jgi:hypothetical protein
LDEWIYFFKNSVVLDEFRAKGMKEVREKMIVHNLPDDERKRYNRFLDNLHTEASIAETVKIEQEEKLAEKVAELEKRMLEETQKRMLEETKKREIAIAINFIKLGLNDIQISEGTGLTINEVQELCKDFQTN